MSMTNYYPHSFASVLQLAAQSPSDHKDSHIVSCNHNQRIRSRATFVNAKHSIKSLLRDYCTDRAKVTSKLYTHTSLLLAWQRCVARHWTGSGEHPSDQDWDCVLNEEWARATADLSQTDNNIHKHPIISKCTVSHKCKLTCAWWQLRSHQNIYTQKTALTCKQPIHCQHRFCHISISSVCDLITFIIMLYVVYK